MATHGDYVLHIILQRKVVIFLYTFNRFGFHMRKDFLLPGTESKTLYILYLNVCMGSGG